MPFYEYFKPRRADPDCPAPARGFTEKQSDLAHLVLRELVYLRARPRRRRRERLSPRGCNPDSSSLSSALDRVPVARPCIVFPSSCIRSTTLSLSPPLLPVCSPLHTCAHAFASVSFFFLPSASALYLERVSALCVGAREDPAPDRSAGTIYRA